MRKFAFVALLAFAGSASAVPISEPHDIDDHNQVGYTYFDVISEGIFHVRANNENGGSTYDNGQFFPDPQLYLFKNDGHLGADDLVAENDDRNSSGNRNSLIRNIYLSVGSYIAAVSDWHFSLEEAVSGMNSTGLVDGVINVRVTAGNGGMNSDNGYTPEARLSVPEPTSLALLGMGMVAFGVVRRRRSSVK